MTPPLVAREHTKHKNLLPSVEVNKRLRREEEYVNQSITFEVSDRSRSLPLALINFLASELSLAPIREIARYKLCLSKR